MEMSSSSKSEISYLFAWDLYTSRKMKSKIVIRVFWYFFSLSFLDKTNLLSNTEEPQKTPTNVETEDLAVSSHLQTPSTKETVYNGFLITCNYVFDSLCWPLVSIPILRFVSILLVLSHSTIAFFLFSNSSSLPLLLNRSKRTASWISSKSILNFVFLIYRLYTTLNTIPIDQIPPSLFIYNSTLSSTLSIL